MQGKAIIGSRKARKGGKGHEDRTVLHQLQICALLFGTMVFGRGHGGDRDMRSIGGRRTINQSVEEISQKILLNSLEVAAFCCYIWNIGMVQQVIRRLKAQRPGLTVVLGGPEVTFRAGRDPFSMAGSVLCALRRRRGELSCADAGPGGKADAGWDSRVGSQR